MRNRVSLASRVCDDRGARHAGWRRVTAWLYGAAARAVAARLAGIRKLIGLLLGLQLGQVLGSPDQAIPVGGDVFRWTADLSNDRRRQFGGNHLDGVPGANQQLVGVRLLAWDVNAYLAAHTAL